MGAKKRLGVNVDLYCSPVFNCLAGEVTLECIVDLVGRNAIKLREHDLDGAFLTTIDYARESSDYCIIPNVAVSSREATNTIVLCFKEGLHTINTLAVRPTSTSEIVLAAILLEERFDARPKIVPIMSAFDEALRTADAVLLVGNEAMEQASHHKNKLDLVEEWSDMTNLPYVHGFWCVREENVSKNDVAVIQQACKRDMESIEDIVHAEIAKRDLQIPPNVLKQYFERFSFTFTEEEQEALTEFLRYAYYHGVVPDVADLNFYPTMDTEDDLPLFDPSLN